MRNKILALLTVISSGILAQGNSPFSVHGPGDIFGSNFTTNYAQSGIGASTSYSNQINAINPASYSDIKFTVGEVGVISSTNSYQLNGSTDVSNHTNLSGFAFGFPLAKNLGMAFGISPYSKQNYSYFIEDQLPDLSAVKYVYEGNGGLNKVFLGTGYKVKGLSIGVNGQFMFGRLERTSKVFYDAADYGSIRFRNFTNVRGFSWNTGIQYEFDLNEELFAKIGGTYQIQANYNTESYEKSNYFYVTDTIDTNDEVAEDAEFNLSTFITDTENAPTEGSITLPQSIQSGITIGKKDNWTLSAEVALTSWENFVWGGEVTQMKNSQKYMLGGTYIPNIQALGKENYWKSIQYNWGMKYGMSQVVMNNEQLPEYGITLGLSLPLKKFKYETEKFGSMLNLSMGYMHRGNGSATSINEDYVTLNVSVTLNDKWFIKRKFN